MRATAWIWFKWVYRMIGRAIDEYASMKQEFDVAREADKAAKAAGADGNTPPAAGTVKDAQYQEMR